MPYLVTFPDPNMQRLFSGDSLAVNCQGMNAWSIRMEGMTQENTIIAFEGTLDGENWSPLQATELAPTGSATTNKSSTFLGGSLMPHRLFNGTCNGLRHVRVRVIELAAGDHVFARGQIVAEAPPAVPFNPYADPPPWSISADASRRGKTKLPGVLEYDAIRIKERTGGKDPGVKRVARSRAAGKPV
jgi:hypothetical protein